MDDSLDVSWMVHSPPNTSLATNGDDATNSPTAASSPLNPALSPTAVVTPSPAGRPNSRGLMAPTGRRSRTPSPVVLPDALPSASTPERDVSQSHGQPVRATAPALGSHLRSTSSPASSRRASWLASLSSRFGGGGGNGSNGSVGNASFGSRRAANGAAVPGTSPGSGPSFNHSHTLPPHTTPSSSFLQQTDLPMADRINGNTDAGANGAIATLNPHPPKEKEKSKGKDKSDKTRDGKDKDKDGSAESSSGSSGIFGTLRRLSSASTPNLRSLASSANSQAGAADGINGDSKTSLSAAAAASSTATPSPPPPPPSPGPMASLRSRAAAVAGFGSSSAHRHGIVDRCILNVNPYRDRCPVPQLQSAQADLRCVAFNVDVEIAPPPVYLNPKDKRSTSPLCQKARRKAAAAAAAAASNDAATSASTAAATGSGPSSASSPTIPTVAATQPPSAALAAPATRTRRKADKADKSKPEKRSRAEQKRLQAEANGQIPLEIFVDSDSSSDADSIASCGASAPSASGPTPGSAAATASSVLPSPTTVPNSISSAPASPRQPLPCPPTTNPLRIYRRCCALRESPILKRVTEQLAAAASSAAFAASGIVDRLDFANYDLQLADLVVLGDFLAIVAVRELVLDNVGLQDDGLRVVLGGLLAARSPAEAAAARRCRQPRHWCAAPDCPGKRPSGAGLGVGAASGPVAAVTPSPTTAYTSISTPTAAPLAGSISLSPTALIAPAAPAAAAAPISTAATITSTTATAFSIGGTAPASASSAATAAPPASAINATPPAANLTASTPPTSTRPQPLPRHVHSHPPPPPPKHGVIERLVLRNNFIGPAGWEHLITFIYLGRSLKWLDVSNCPSFPKPPAESATHDGNFHAFSLFHHPSLFHHSKGGPPASTAAHNPKQPTPTLPTLSQPQPRQFVPRHLRPNLDHARALAYVLANRLATLGPAAPDGTVTTTASSPGSSFPVSTSTPKPPNPTALHTVIFNPLEMLNLGNTRMLPSQLAIIVDGLIAGRVRRVGLANNLMDSVAISHVARLIRARTVIGLDISGNNIRGEIDLLANALAPEPNNPLTQTGPESASRVAPDGNLHAVASANGSGSLLSLEPPPSTVPQSTPPPPTLPPPPPPVCLRALSLGNCSLDAAAFATLLCALGTHRQVHFLDLSHNRDLFADGSRGSKPSLSIANNDNNSAANGTTYGTIYLSPSPSNPYISPCDALKVYLPKLQELRRIHFADVSLGPSHAVTIAHILPRMTNLAHINILGNPRISEVARGTPIVNGQGPKTVEAANDRGLSLQAGAMYAAFVAAARASPALVNVDIDRPGLNQPDIVKAVARLVVAYCLRNLDRLQEANWTLASAIANVGANTQSASATGDPTANSVADGDVDLLESQLIQSLIADAEQNDSADATKPSKATSKIGETLEAVSSCRALCRVLKEDGLCNVLSGQRHAQSGDLASSLLLTARRLREGLRPALDESTTSRNQNSLQHCRLAFMDETLRQMIHSLERDTSKKQPDSQIATSSRMLATPESDSASSLSASASISAPTFPRPATPPTTPPSPALRSAADDREEPPSPFDAAETAVRPSAGLARSNSVVSVNSKALIDEEARALRLGHNLRANVLTDEIQIHSNCIEQGQHAASGLPAFSLTTTTSPASLERATGSTLNFTSSSTVTPPPPSTGRSSTRLSLPEAIAALEVAVAADSRMTHCLAELLEDLAEFRSDSALTTLLAQLRNSIDNSHASQSETSTSSRLEKTSPRASPSENYLQTSTSASPPTTSNTMPAPPQSTARIPNPKAASAILDLFRNERDNIIAMLRDRDPENWERFIESQMLARANAAVLSRDLQSANAGQDSEGNGGAGHAIPGSKVSPPSV